MEAMRSLVPFAALLTFISLPEAPALSIGSRFRFGKKSMPALETTIELKPIVEVNGKDANGSKLDYGDRDLRDIFRQNLAWKKAKEDADPNYFEKMGSVHKPKYMWIGK
jgi:hypothetical protein